MPTRATLTIFAALALAANAARPAHGAPRSPSPAETAAELARLQAEVREQRALIMQLVRVEQEHYDLLLRLIQGRGADPGAAAPPPPPADKPAAAVEADEPSAARPAPSRAPTATLRGRVAFPGGSLKDVFVYVENVKAPPVRGKSIEIAQRDKQFVPDVAVIQRGTRVTFPNYDTVFHNVFSPTAPHPFDLGSYRAGEPAKSVELMSPGVVDVFCNMHARMRASVLVVPSPLFTRVAADGSFDLHGVPVGTRKVVVWGPRSKPAAETVELGPAGGELSITLVSQPPVAHNNKVGQPYSSYKD
jgi:plastocyanin